jgi:hypothetical protein
MAPIIRINKITGSVYRHEGTQNGDTYKLHIILKENGLAKQFSVEKMLLELEKIKKYQLENGEIMVSEVTKKNRAILEAFNLCA